ncbi:hypothetical protein PSACC_01843 [Paramicrosporidium saccamoebae]|uniref:Uncharacterized protein n=1 Tax=Paramicrosporidium saccamoebae TaxID=1246581 RepID=A0A2H9TL37_9FUNG|nr:hypothetical protein PSACC_01843 [Paramicrosporidium saccamoebae]
MALNIVDLDMVFILVLLFLARFGAGSNSDQPSSAPETLEYQSTRPLRLSSIVLRVTAPLAVGEEISARLDYLDLLEEHSELISATSLPNLEALASQLCIPIPSEPKVFRVLRIFKCTQYFSERLCEGYPRHRCCGLPFDKFPLLLKTGAAKKGEPNYYRRMRSHVQPLLEHLLRRIRRPALIVLPVIDYSRFNIKFQLALFQTFKLVIPRNILYYWALYSLENTGNLRIFRELAKKINSTLSGGEKLGFVQRALIKIYLFEIDLYTSGDWHVAGSFYQYMQVMLEYFPKIVLDQWGVLYHRFEEEDLALIQQVSTMRKQVVAAWALLGDGLRVLGMFHRSLQYSTGAMESLQLSRIGTVQVFDFLCALTSFHNHPEYNHRKLLVAKHLLSLFGSPGELFETLQLYNTYRILDIILTVADCPFVPHLIAPLINFGKYCDPQFLATILHRVRLDLPATIECVECQVVADIYHQSLYHPRIDPCQGEDVVTWRIPNAVEADIWSAATAVRTVMLFFLGIPLQETLIDESTEPWSYSEYNWMLSVMTDRYCQIRFGRGSRIKFKTQMPTAMSLLSSDSVDELVDEPVDELANELSVLSLKKASR